ncbi:MAG TPA: glycosyl hydrolase family 18 protein [Clostridia bacterium]|nr:glycosyl hydrolase family 18 protein [Clostridia bacterium]
MKKLFVLLAAITFTFAAVGIIYYISSMPNNKVVPAFDEGKLNLVIEGNIINLRHPVQMVNNEILLPLDIVKEYFDPYIFWDSKLQKLSVTTKNKVIRMKTDSLNALVNNKPVTLNIPVSISRNTVYVPIQFLSGLYKIKINYIKENNVIIIDYINRTKKAGTIAGSGLKIRNGMSLRHPIVKKYEQAKVAKGISVMIYSGNDRWCRVRTPDGVIGYIEKKYITQESEIKNEPAPDVKNQAAWKPSKGKINMVWDYFSRVRSGKPILDDAKGLDVVSPTWFAVENAKGEIRNNASAGYVQTVHAKGLKVWAMISNDSTDPDMTSEFLNNTDSRDNIIRQMLAYASLYNLDGINIDFENIKKSDKGALTQFVREITPLLKEQGLVVSIDVTIPDGSDNWSKCYDRAELGQVVDYVMLMAYDQYWSTSPVAGSVAEFGWVEDNLKKVLELVPKEKLLLGLPFYSREWIESNDGQGKVTVSRPARTLTMEKEHEIIDENNAKVVWNAEMGQFYAEFSDNDSVHRIWVEDSNSINIKSSLVQKYGLAGACSWRKGFETAEVWDVLRKNLKDIGSYQQWLNDNKSKKYAFK